jgi:Arc/MetJ family transcription regulator
MMPQGRRRTLWIAPETLDAAAGVLGTKGVTQTVNAALEEVVRAELRRELINTRFADLTPEGVLDRRQARSAAAGDGVSGRRKRSA